MFWYYRKVYISWIYILKSIHDTLQYVSIKKWFIKYTYSRPSKTRTYPKIPVIPHSLRQIHAHSGPQQSE